MDYANGYSESGNFETFEDTASVFKAIKVRLIAFFAAFFIFYYAIFLYFSFGLVLFGTRYYFYYILVSSIALSMLAALSITLGFYSQKAVKSSAAGSRSGIYAFVVSRLVPSTMCCTPVIPSILVAVFGSGGIALASGAIQGVLSNFSPAFILVAALLLYYSVHVSLKRIKKPSCEC